MRAAEAPAPVRLLLAEDNPADARLVREVLRESHVANEVIVARDGVETMEYLQRKGAHANAPRPDVVLLDLNMPRKDGREVLAEMKADPSIRRIPVIVMTTSPAEEDILAAYDHHANCYIRKPIDFVQFQATVRKLEMFWFTLAELPFGQPGPGAVDAAST
jgi:chemotaxis family two-component system response regulator Rcp1